MKKRSWWWGLCGVLMLTVAMLPGRAAAVFGDLTVSAGETINNPTRANGYSDYLNGYIDGTVNVHSVNLTFVQGMPVPAYLYLGTTSTDHGVLNLDTHSTDTGLLWVAGSEYIGQNGSGTFTQGGGSNTVDSCLYLGANIGSSGTYDLSGGSLSADSEYIGQGSSGTFTQTGGINTIKQILNLGTGSGSSGTYELSDGSLSANSEAIGFFGSGTFTQTGGTNTIKEGLGLGTLGGTGTYELSGGSLSANSEAIGLFGSGTFTQTGGTNTVDDGSGTAKLLVGDSGGAGWYTLSGGSLQVDGANGGGEYIGDTDGGTGIFTQSGGNHTVTGGLNLGSDSLGSGTGGTGTYNLNNGSLSVDNEIIGGSGSGSFTQSGGTHTLSGKLELGDNSGSSGTYELSGGSLSANYEYIGDYGSGSFTQSGGTHTIKNTLYLGEYSGSSGTYELSGGSLSANSEYIGESGSGSFTQSGGTHTVSGELDLGHQSGSGTYNLSGGSLSANLEIIGCPYGTGDFTQTGGTHTVGGELDLGDIGGTGTYNLQGGSLSANSEYIGKYGSGTFTQTGGTHTVSGELGLGGPGGSGTYNLSGGSLSAIYEEIGLTGSASFTQTGGSLSAIYEFIGLSGSGTFTQSGGTHTVSGFLDLGYDPGVIGTYTLSNAGSLLASGIEYVGYYGSGTFTQTGGTHTVSGFLALAFNTGSSGTYSLRGGSLSANYESIGGSGSGTFTQSGGTHTVSGRLDLGDNGGTGTYDLSGGSLSANSEYIGFGGSGSFTQSGGTHTVAGILTLTANDGSSTYNLQDGTLTTGTLNINAKSSFNQTGGTFDATTINQTGGIAAFTSLYLGRSFGSSGTCNLQGGSLTASGSEYIGYGGTGTFTQSGGSNTVAGGLIIGDNPGSRGTYNFFGGSLSAGTVDVNSGGVFRGFGTIDSGTFTNRGLVAPGASPGTLTINGGPYTQPAGGTLEVEVASPTSYDKLNVIGAPGTASLNGTVKLILLNGYIPQGNQIFPGVVTAANGLSGTFSNLANAQITSTLSWQTRYTANSFDLLVQRNYSNSLLAPLTHNQYAVGVMLNGVANTATGDLNTVLNAIDSLTSASAVANAYQQISADKVAALPTLAFAEANLQKGVLSRRITDLRFGSRETGVLGGLPGSFNLNYSQGAGLMLAYNSANLAGMLTSERKAGLAPEGRWGVYLDPAMVFGAQQSSANQTGFDFTIAGFNAGADYRLRDDLLVGLATGYSHTGAAFHGSGGSVENSTWPLTAYAAYLPKSFYAYGSLGYALNLFDLKRQISFGGLNRIAHSSPTGNQFNAYGEAGYDLRLRRLVVTPVVSLAYSSLWLNRFTEGGAGALDLNVSSQQATSLQTGVGGKIALPLRRNSTVVVPQIYATYQHEYSDSSRGLDARLSQAGNTFVFQTDNPHRNFVVAGADVTILARKNLTVYLDYNAEVGRGNYTAHYVSAEVRWQF